MTVANISGSFTRPNDTTAYASGDLVANSTTAGSVVPVTLGGFGESGGAGSTMIRRCVIRKSGTGTTSASFRVHLYDTSSITFANGDNSAWSTNKVANYLGAFDVTVDRAFTDGAWGAGAPVTGSELLERFASGQSLYAVVEARGAYTPTANEVFTITLDEVKEV